MPFMVGNIVVLNSGSPPMTVKAITHAGQVLCQWIDSGGVLHEMEFAPGRARHVAAVNGARPMRNYGKGARGGEVCGNDGPGCGRCAYAYAMPNVIPTASTAENTAAFSVRCMERSRDLGALK